MVLHIKPMMSTMIVATEEMMMKQRSRRPSFSHLADDVTHWCVP
jgi:hypothetical protein